MSNSSLVKNNVWCAEGNYTRGRDGRRIEKIALHHMAGKLTSIQCGRIFQQAGRKASAHYGVGCEAEIGLYVDEYNTAWANSNWDVNCKSVSIEISNSSTTGNYPVSDNVLKKAIELIADIALRNSLGKLVKGQNLVWHSMYANTYCPGDYLRSKMDYIVSEANKLIDKTNSKGTLYKVQVGAFKIKSYANNLEKELKKKRIDTYQILRNGYYKVQCGAYSSVSNAKNMAKKLNELGYNVYIEGL